MVRRSTRVSTVSTVGAQDDVSSTSALRDDEYAVT
jgi:hypothetical protein